MHPKINSHVRILKMANTTFTGPVISTNGFVTSAGGVTAAEIAITGDADLLGSANVIIIPTSDPGVTGAIWNNAGTLAVSA
jgi:hypothetical protein